MVQAIDDVEAFGKAVVADEWIVLGHS